MSEAIICKPTPWFLLRAGVMLLMFGVFSVMFFADGKWGYREQNLSYYVWKATDRAKDEFTAQQDKVTPGEWKSYAAEQTVAFPEDRSILPEGLEIPMPWPEKLGDYDFMKAGLGNPKEQIFKGLMEDVGLSKGAPEHDFDARKIFEQWVMCWVCAALAAGALVVLLRTLGRRMAIGDGMLTAPGAKSLPVSDLVRLDLRKWGNKGLAFAWASDGRGGERKLRLDGLTYGGFKKEDDQPAERFMERLKAEFSGEIIEYAEEETASEEPPEGQG